MFNLLSGMNPEKLAIAFLSGMPVAKKEEWLIKIEESRQAALQTSNDFAHIKETVDTLLDRLNEANERLSTLTGIQLGRIEDIAQSTKEPIQETIEVAATEAAIAADNTDEILYELKDGE